MATPTQSLTGRLTVAIASGKGGTGKTLVATNLAVAAGRSGTPTSLVDCDADAPNDALFLSPVSVQAREVTVLLPVVDEDACTLCGLCRTTCAYGAIRILGGTVMVFPELCHNCGACLRVCQPRALSEVPVRVGEVEWGSVAPEVAPPAGIDVVTGRLDIGEVKTPTIVRAARRQAEVLNKTLTVLDSPPGVACAAVASIRNSDVLVLVTEPTPFGLHDLELTVDLGRAMGIPIGVVVNRDVGASSEVDAYCERNGIPILSRIPFDRRVAEIYASGGLVIDEHPSGDEWFGGLWRAVHALAEEDV